jgi:hypothetical protein
MTNANVAIILCLIFYSSIIFLTACYCQLTFPQLPLPHVSGGKVADAPPVFGADAPPLPQEANASAAIRHKNNRRMIFPSFGQAALDGGHPHYLIFR